jgi:hypothetical protein
MMVEEKGGCVFIGGEIVSSMEHERGNGTNSSDLLCGAGKTRGLNGGNRKLIVIGMVSVGDGCILIASCVCRMLIGRQRRFRADSGRITR